MKQIKLCGRKAKWKEISSFRQCQNDISWFKADRIENGGYEKYRLKLHEWIGIDTIGFGSKAPGILRGDVKQMLQADCPNLCFDFYSIFSTFLLFHRIPDLKDRLHLWPFSYPATPGQSRLLFNLFTPGSHCNARYQCGEENQYKCGGADEIVYWGFGLRSQGRVYK